MIVTLKEKNDNKCWIYVDFLIYNDFKDMFII